MFLVLTMPHRGDYFEFFKLTLDQDIKKEFLNFADFDLHDAVEHINDWIEINKDNSPNNLRLIKIANSDSEPFTQENSELIGFISISPTGPIDRAITGCDNMMNFGVIEGYRNKGIMTDALKMQLSWLKQKGYNLIYCLVKSHNSPSCRVLEKVGFKMIERVATGYLYCYRFR